MSTVQLITRGDRELALRFETFPADAKKRLVERITGLTEQLADRVEAATPKGKTRRLSSEIHSRVFVSGRSGSDRIAGYVSVYAPDRPSEYAKAATLEYGTEKPRRIFEKSSLAARLSKRRLVRRMSKPVHIAAFMYLRRPLDEMRAQIEAELDEALAEAADEGDE